MQDQALRLVIAILTLAGDTVNLGITRDFDRLNVMMSRLKMAMTWNVDSRIIKEAKPVLQKSREALSESFPITPSCTATFNYSVRKRGSEGKTRL